MRDETIEDDFISKVEGLTDRIVLAYNNELEKLADQFMEQGE